MNPRRQLNDLIAQRQQQLTAAETALEAHNHEEYNSAMERVTNMNAEIKRLQDLIAEQDRQFAAPAAPQSAAEQRDAMEARVEALRRGDAVNYDLRTLLSGIRGGMLATVTVGTETVVMPEGAGSIIHGGDRPICSIVDLVHTIDATGMGSFVEPYVAAEMAAKGAKVKTAAGTLRGETDPTFRTAKISPYEVTTTSFVDRNLANMSPAAYDAKIQQLAFRALRKKLSELILLGDGQASPEFFGITTAKNTKGESIFKALPLAALDEDALNELVFSYGGDEEVGGDARLFLDRADLKTLGAIRGAADLNRVFGITKTAGSTSMGEITDGGLIVPYGLASALKDKNQLVYGDPKNFELAFFGGMTVRIDESYKAGERMNTVLGDVIVGGNIIEHEGFVVGTVGG